MSLVDTSTGEAVVLLDRAEAEVLTAKIKSYAGVTWQLLNQAHDHQAWRAMGYGSWAEYVRVEFDMTRSYAYRLISHARAVAELEASAGIDPEVSPMGDTLTERQTRDIDVPAVAGAIRDAVADLPDDAPAEDRAAVATEVIESRRRTERTTAHADPTPEPEPTPEPAPLVDPMLERRAAASTALVRATDLFRLDPVQVAADAHPDDRDDWAHFAAEVQEWGARLAVQFAASNRLRSVQ